MATLFAASVIAKPAAAQEIQLTGPLAGAPSVRKQRLYRKNRFEVAVGPGFTLLDEYQRTIFVNARLQYNLFDFFGFGVFGGFGAASLSTDLTDKIDSTAPRNSRTAVNLPPKGDSFANQTGQLKWMASPQLSFSPFRGKLALFQKLFVDTDLYIAGGPMFVGVQERADCTICTPQAGKPSPFATNTRTAITGSGALGLTLYFSQFVSMNVEYRAYPFSWNRGGFDSRGTGPDASFPDNKIDSNDRTFKFNQMIFIGAGFSFPTKATISE